MTPRLARLVALVLTGAGAAAVVAGLAPAGRSLDLRERGVVNTDRPGINAHNSPAAAADPTRPATLVVADRIDTPRYSCSISRSTNGGQSWQPLSLPLAEGAANCFTPDVAFAAGGDLLVLYTTVGGRFSLPVALWLQRFTDGAAAGLPVAVAGPLAFHATLEAAGATVLVAWAQAAPETVDKPIGLVAPTRIMLARSTDGGSTFAPPVAVSEPGLRVVAPTVVIAGSRVVVGALDLAGDVADFEATHEGQGGEPYAGRWRIVTWASEGSQPFGATTVVHAEVVPPARIIVNLAPRPSFAADPSTGRLYAVWD
ncbi:MAG: hypothetical protein ACRD0F_10605, partial [Acidimicrobiales bacterium]